MLDREPSRVLIEAMEAEGLGGGGVVAAAFGDVQVAGVLEGRDDGSADGGQVGRPAAGAAGRGVLAEGHVADVMRLAAFLPSAVGKACGRELATFRFSGVPSPRKPSSPR